MISSNEFDSLPRSNHKYFQDNCYLEGSHVKLHQDGVTWVSTLGVIERLVYHQRNCCEN